MNKPRKQPAQPLDPLSLYMNAERFRIADNYMRTSGNSDPYLMSIIGVPCLVVSAFAIELYLKCLLCIETGSAPQTHNLKALFCDLSHSTQARIENLWLDDANRPENRAMRKIVENNTGQAPPVDFISSLESGSEAFIRLRYLHENAAPKVSFFLAALPTILHNIILEIRPEWKTVCHAPPTPH